MGSWRRWAVVPLSAAAGGRGAPPFSQCWSLSGVMRRGEFGGIGRKPQLTSVGADDGDISGAATFVGSAIEDATSSPCGFSGGNSTWVI